MKRRKACILLFTLLMSSPLCCTRVDATTIAGNALLFDGDNDFARIPHSAHLNFGSSQSFTIELRFNPSMTDDHEQNLISKRKYTSGSGTYHSVRLDYDNLHGGFRDTQGNEVRARATTKILENQGYHLALVRNVSTSEVRFFVNGQVEGIESDITLDILPTLDLILGKITYVHPHNFAGLMDEVHIWDTALSDNYIAENYIQIINNPGSVSNLIGYWNFDEDFSNQNIFDLSSYGHNGMLGNTLLVGPDDPSRVPSTAPLVPEPTTGILLGIGNLVMLRRRRL